MKSATRNAYACRIDRALVLVQRAIETGVELPDLADLAAAAQFSPFHFHRVYRALTGETIGHTVARLRLLRALHLLERPDVSVTEIAMAIGYETPQAFARAFRAEFGATPTGLRSQPERLAQGREALSRPLAADPTAPSALQVRVVSVEPFEVVALRNHGDYADLDQVYGRLFAWAADVGLVERIAGLYGLPWQDRRDAPAAHYEFDCAVRIAVRTDPPAPLRMLALGGGEHARMRHVGSFDGLEDACDRLLAHWLPDSGYELRDIPIHHHYLDDPDETPEAMLRTDIYVPVRRAVAS